MATPYGADVAAIVEQYNKSLHKGDEEPATMVTLDEVIVHQNRAHIALGDGFERTEYEADVPEEELVTLDEVMLHQNRILHNEDGFRPEDYRA